MALVPVFLVVDPKTGAAEAYQSQHEAWDAASCAVGRDQGWIVENYAERVVANPARSWPDAEKGLELSRLPRLSACEDVMRIPLDVAWRALRDYLPKTSDFRSLGVFVGADTSKGMLRENSKLIKALKSGRGATQVGLQLVPEYSVFVGHGAGNNEKKFKLRRLPQVLNEVTVTQQKKSTLCAGSSEQCRSACLQFSGQNVSPDAVNAKHRTTLALLDHPREFCRLLVEACQRFAKNAERKGLFPYIRLNVLSDVPWELVFPGLFDLVHGRRRKIAGRNEEHLFYDYTKLVKRGPWAARNYQITYSFSGVNMDACHEELRRGTNVTVAFLHVYRADDGKIRPIPRKTRQKKTAEGEYVYTLPKVWEGAVGGGRPVMDGDKDDLRPLDPHRGAWVGLRYKAAAGITDKNVIQKVGKFVVHCWEDTDTGLFVAAETPGQTNVATGER